MAAKQIWIAAATPSPSPKIEDKFSAGNLILNFGGMPKAGSHSPASSPRHVVGSKLVSRPTTRTFLQREIKKNLKKLEPQTVDIC